MIRKRDLLAYCDSLSEDVARLEEVVYKLKIEVANLKNKKTIDGIKRKVGRPKKNQ